MPSLLGFISGRSSDSTVFYILFIGFSDTIEPFIVRSIGWILLGSIGSDFFSSYNSLKLSFSVSSLVIDERFVVALSFFFLKSAIYNGTTKQYFKFLNLIMVEI